MTNNIITRIIRRIYEWGSRLHGKLQVIFKLRGVSADYIIPFASAVVVIFTFLNNNSISSILSIDSHISIFQLGLFIASVIVLFLIFSLKMTKLFSRYYQLRDNPERKSYSREYFNRLFRVARVDNNSKKSGYRIGYVNRKGSDKEYYIMSNRVNEKLYRDSIGCTKNSCLNCTEKRCQLYNPTNNNNIEYNFKKRKILFITRKRKLQISDEIYDLQSYLLMIAFSSDEEKKKRIPESIEELNNKYNIMIHNVKKEQNLSDDNLKIKELKNECREAISSIKAKPRLFNGKRIRLCSDILLTDNEINCISEKKESDINKNKHEIVNFDITDYFSYLCTNELVGYQFFSSHSTEIICNGLNLLLRPYSEMYSPFQIGMENSNKPIVIPLSNSSCSNFLGGSTFVITKDYYVIITLQGTACFVNAGNYAPSGSGSLDIADCKKSHSKSLCQLVITGLEREFREENNIPKNAKMHTDVIGFFRIISSWNHCRGGMPDFVAISYVDMKFEDIVKNSSKVRISESNLSSTCKGHKMDEEDIKNNNVSKGLNSFYDEYTEKNHRMSLQNEVFLKILESYEKRNINIINNVIEHYKQKEKIVGTWIPYNKSPQSNNTGENKDAACSWTFNENGKVLKNHKDIGKTWEYLGNCMFAINPQKRDYGKKERNYSYVPVDKNPFVVYIPSNNKSPNCLYFGISTWDELNECFIRISGCLESIVGEWKNEAGTIYLTINEDHTYYITTNYKIKKDATSNDEIIVQEKGPVRKWYGSGKTYGKNSIGGNDMIVANTNYLIFTRYSLDNDCQHWIKKEK